MSYGTFTAGPSSSGMSQLSKLNSKYITWLAVVMILSVCAMSAVVSIEKKISPQAKVQKVTSTVAGQMPHKQLSLRSQALEGEDEQPSGEGPSGDELTSERFIEVFGWHGTFALIVLIGSIILWVYLRCIRPQNWFREWQKTLQSTGEGFATQKGEAYLDENDITGSLTLVPGEAVFFNEEVALSFGGGFGSCHKLSVTNHRIIAQKTDTILCGTCMLGANEDAWPIANVSKVRLATGEFYGHTVSSLLFYTWFYFGIVLVYDVVQFYLLENTAVLDAMLSPFLTSHMVLAVVSFVANVLVAIAIIYAVGTAVLLIWPHTLLKVYLTRKMEEKSQMFPFSSPMESFTFQTKNAYKAYQAIFAAQSKSGAGTALQGGAYHEIPAGVYTKATAPFIPAPQGRV